MRIFRNQVVSKNNTVLGLLTLKLLTYPIIGFSTLVAFRLVRVRFTLEEFNSFVLIWSSIGIIGIAEYGLGMNLTNHLLIQGFDRDFRHKIKKFSFYLFFPLIVIFFVGFFFQITPKKESILGVSELAGIQLNQFFMSVSASVFFVTCYNLATRISNGVSHFASPHITLAAGNSLALIILVYLPNQSTSLTQYLVVLASAYLFSAFFQVCSRKLWRKLISNQQHDNHGTLKKELNGGNYSVIILLISLFVTFINFFPRWKFSLKESSIEASGYLTIILVVGVFSSISSTLGPVLWNAGVKRKLAGRTTFPRRSYQTVFLVNILSLVPFFAMIAFLFEFYMIEMSSQHFYTSGVVAYFLLSFQNIHMIASNYLVERSELLIQLYLLVLQAFSLAVLIIGLNVQTSLTMYMVQTGITLFLSLIPSVVILRGRQH